MDLISSLLSYATSLNGVSPQDCYSFSLMPPIPGLSISDSLLCQSEPSSLLTPGTAEISSLILLSACSHFPQKHTLQYHQINLTWKLLWLWTPTQHLLVAPMTFQTQANLVPTHFSYHISSTDFLDWIVLVPQKTPSHLCLWAHTSSLARITFSFL